MTQTISMMKAITSRQAGLSLIELMVALAISMLLLAGVITLVANSNQNFQEMTRTSQQLENGRYAVQLLREDLRLAGFYGELFAVPAPTATLPNPCANTLAAQRDGLSFPIQGYDSPAASPLSCIAAANHITETDIVVIRRTSTDSVLRTGYLHLQATPREVVLDLLPEDPEDEDAMNGVFGLTWGLAAPNDRPPVRPYFVYIYYVSPFSTTAGDGIPTLKRVEITATGSSTAPLVEGIENMQFLYGIDDNDDGNPDRYETSVATVDEWTNVVAVQTHLLVRNLEPTAGYSDDKTYNVGGVEIGPLGDNFKRHVYTTTVRLTNPAGRRE